MSYHEEDDESPLERLARLNRILREWTVEDQPSRTLTADEARQLADAVERLLAMIDDIRGNPAARTSERLGALADSVTALLAEIAATPNSPR